MSTKIYGGVIFSVHDFKTLRTRFQALRDPMEAIKSNHLKRIMSNQAIHKFDRMAVGLEEGVPTTDHLFKIKMNTSDEMMKAQKSFTSSYPYDVKCEIGVIPLKTKTLGYLINHMNEHRALFLKQRWVKEYHYQNQTDRPDEITAEEWRIRRYDWDKALPGAGRLSDEAFFFELCSSDFPWDLSFRDIDYRMVNPTEKRARNLAVDRARYELTKDKKDPSVSEILDSNKTEDGKKLVESLYKEYLPKLKDRYELVQSK